MTFKNIIFDLGAVILNIDYNLASEAFKKLGVSDFDELYSKKKQDLLFDKLETGELDESGFRDEIRKHIPHDVTNDQIDSAWNSMLLDLPPGRFQWLQQIGKKYRIFLLSNTNSIHVREFTRRLDAQYGKGAFEKLFEKVYYSCKMKMRKPDKEIFDLVLKENNLEPSETLFIDDSPQHIEGAKKCGIQTLHLKNGMRVELVLGS
jgi:glucose-1-phosphatase